MDVHDIQSSRESSGLSDADEEASTSFIVTTLDDENDGDFSAGDLSLREAIALANEQAGADTITFDPSLSNGTITLTETETDPRGLGTINQDLLITDSLTIEGLGANDLTIDGDSGGGGIFRLEGGDLDVTLAGLNIINGDREQFFFQNPTVGGAILVNDSTADLTLQDSVISGSSASSAGAIYSPGTVNIVGSLIENNQSGGGYFAEGAIVIGADGSLNILNSTITNNSGRGVAGSNQAEISNSTLTDGIDVFGNDLTLTSSIVLDDSDLNASSIGGKPIITSGGNNLIGNGENLDGFVDSDLVGNADHPLDPRLGELQDNGGATATLALLEDSPAIDAGSNPHNLATDQRGEGFNRTVGNATDIGAYELQSNGDEQMNEELIVSTLEDENDGDYSAGDLSLREAIALADNNQTITFDSGLSGGSIVLSQGELLIDKSLSINGLGANNLIISGNDEFRVFQVNDGDASNQLNVSIDGLTITEGSLLQSTTEANSINGAGFLNQENLVITNSALVDNDAGNGGAIFNTSTGQLRVENSLLSENSGGTGPIFNDGGSASIVNTTIANNGTAGIGAIVNTDGGSLTLANSTVTDNNAFDAAVSNSDNSTATVTSSIIAGNSGEFIPERDDVIGTFVSNGNNLIGNNNASEGFDNPSDLVGTADNPLDPKLSELQDNGGLTQTIALLEDSPAIDAGSNPNNLTTDQRGEGFNRTVGNGTDIGAYEVQDSGNGEIPDELIVSTLEDEHDGDYSAGDLSLREAIALANEQAGADIIDFDSNLNGSIVLTQGELVIEDSVTINGLGADTIAVDGNYSSRIFQVNDFDDNNLSTVSINDLNLINGNTTESGGAIQSYENLTVTNSVIANNSAGDLGGGINQASFDGTLTVIDTTIKDNTGRRGGGIQFSFGNAEVQNSIVSGNVANTGGGIDQGSGGNLQVSNSTVANNTANTRSGGGIYNGYGEIAIANSTITGNTSSESFGGGAVYNGGTANITSSIVAENNNGDLAGLEFVSGGNNLIGNGDNVAGFSNGANGDLVGTSNDPIDPGLGELQDNGGTTQTFALLEDSLAIDAGSNPLSLTTDQRGEGFSRTVGNGTDIGAYELQTIVLDESIIGTPNGDRLEGTSADDRIFGLDGDDFLEGLDGNDLIDGGDGGDRIFGGAGVDTINDGAGDDILWGGADGDVFIASNAGSDLFRGGAGENVYVYDLNADAGFFEEDGIIDFQPSADKIAFRPLVADDQSLDNFDDLDTNGSGVLDLEDERIQILGSSTVIDFSDLFGRPSGSDTITLFGANDLNSDNFIFDETMIGTEFA